MGRYKHMGRMAGATVLATIILGVAACGSSDGGASTSEGGSAEQSSAAKAKLDEAIGSSAFTVPSLSKTPPKGKVIAQVNCAYPTCSPGEMATAAESLGWEVEEFQYDLTKGPSDYQRAVEAAVRSSPDYLAITASFPDSLIKDSLETAKKDGVPVFGNGTEDTAHYAMIVQGAPQIETLGRLAADMVLADGSASSVAIPNDTSVPTLDGMAKGMVSEFEDLGGGVDVEQIDLSLSRPQAQNVTAIVNFLTTNSKVDTLLLPSTTFYGGLRQALEASGLTDRVKVYLAAPFSTDLQAIENGEIDKTLAGFSEGFAWILVDGMARLSVDDEITSQFPAYQYRVITQEDVTPESADPAEFSTVFRDAWGA